MPSTVRPRVRVIRLLALVTLLAMGAVSATLRFGTDVWWPATALAFAPRWPWALPLAPLALAALLWDRRTLVPLAAAGALFAFVIADLQLSLGRAATAAGPSLRIATYNAQNRIRTGTQLVRAAEVAGADILVVQECAAADLTAPAGWTVAKYNYQCVATKHRLVASDPRDPSDVWAAGGSGAIVRYEIDAPAGKVNLLNVHLETVRSGLEALMEKRMAGVPEMQANIRQRETESALARAHAARGGGPGIIAGDFNMPVESAIYRRHFGDLENALSRCGRGSGATKHTRWHGIRIDHVLLGKDWQCTAAQTLPFADSDHRMVIVDLVRR